MNEFILRTKDKKVREKNYYIIIELYNPVCYGVPVQMLPAIFIVSAALLLLAAHIGGTARYGFRIHKRAVGGSGDDRDIVDVVRSFHLLALSVLNYIPINGIIFWRYTITSFFLRGHGNRKNFE